jgi:hypothetical protein
LENGVDLNPVFFMFSLFVRVWLDTIVYGWLRSCTAGYAVLLSERKMKKDTMPDQCVIPLIP